MKKPLLVLAAERVVARKMRAIDHIVADLIEPLEDVGNPEKLIKKPYAQWTPEDKDLLIKIYGTGENSPLSRLVFNREYERVTKLEAEERI